MVKDTEMIYGLHSVRHALRHMPERILKLWVQEGKRAGSEAAELISLSQSYPISIEYLPKSELDRHTGHAVHQGVVIECKADSAAPGVDLDSILESKAQGHLLFLVLDGIQDPHNLGACLRTANAAAVNAVIIPRDRAVSITPTVRKVASGAAENTPVIEVTNLARTLRKLKDAGIWIIGTDDKAAQSLYDIDLDCPLAIVMGAEGQGLRHNTRKHCDYLSSLPLLGVVESLNVSVATGICLYEALRQRNARHK